MFYRRGIIESWGRGTIKMAEATKQAGAPPLEIEEAGGCVTVRFKPSTYLPPQCVEQDLTYRQQAILTLLDRAGEGLPLREIHGGLEAPATLRQVREDLVILKSLDLITLTGRGRGAMWTHV